MKSALILVLLIASSVLSWSAAASVPGEINYQGLLLDDVGAPVTASVAIEFEIFDDASAGTSLWFESHPNVQVVDGIYDVILGQTNPITPALVEGGGLHLEISIEGETLSPRQQLLVVPYALRAAVSENTEQVSGFSAEYFDEIITHVSLDGHPPDNLDPREGLGDVDADGIANFVDPDNDGDGLHDGIEVAQGSDINVVTPWIAGFSPTTADGFETTSIQVLGTNFEPGMTVVFGNQTPTPTNLTPTSFDVLVGSQPEGTAPVSATLVNGESASSSFDFFLLDPIVESYAPSVFDQGQAGTITLTGQNFISGMTVQFGAQIVVPTNITQTSCDISVAGTESPGTVTVLVSLPNGNSVSNSDFTINVGAPRTIFVTSTEFSGNLGGLAGADATCQQIAQQSGLTGTFQAWLADSSESPSTRESRAGAPYLRTDGATIANDWADLTDGTVDVAITYTQAGNEKSIEKSVWTNVAAIGAGAATIHNCTNWTADAIVAGRYGHHRATDSTWTEWGTGTVCSVTQSLYCVEQ